MSIIKRISPKVFFVFIFLCYISSQGFSQYSTKKVKSKHEAYTDSLKRVEYDYVFPVWGQGAYSKGFDIPYPAGIMANYMWLKQGIVIDNLQLGLKTDSVDIPLTDVGFIEFGDNYNTSYTINVRPDLWIFPFLNVYGIFGYGSSDTEVNLVAPIELQSIVTQNISTAGVGILAAFGIGPVWVSCDANWTWNKPDLLDKAVKVNVLGLRVGHTFTFSKKPERNIAVWLGAMRLNMASETSGQIMISDALGPDAAEKKEKLVSDYIDWREGDGYNNLSPGEKVAVNKILDPLVDRIANSDGDAIIRYGMDKQVKEMWNGSIGAQFQLNKHWMLRTEAGIFGERKSYLASLNYRFLL